MITSCYFTHIFPFFFDSFERFIMGEGKRKEEVGCVEGEGGGTTGTPPLTTLFCLCV